jgi:hypothetical protein
VRSHKRWTSIEIRPDTPATIEYSEVEQAYWLTWEPVGLAIGLSEDELRAIVADAMIAQAQATMTSSNAS